MVADEVQDREPGLVGGLTQSAAQLLQEEQAGLGGPQHGHPVHPGDVDALIEQVDRAEGVQLAALQRLQGALAVGALGVHRQGPDPLRGEPVIDELRVGDGAAEDQRAGPWMGLPGLPEGLHPGLGLHRTAELFRLPARAAPGNLGVVRRVGQAEVVEGDQHAAVDALADVRLEGHLVVEEVVDGPRVSSLGGGGESQPEGGPEVVEEGPIAGGGGVVDLVHDDVVECVGLELEQSLRPGELLDRGEDDVAGRVLVGPDEPAHVLAPEEASEGPGRLYQQLLTVGHDQGPRHAAQDGPHALHVEGGQVGLAHAGGQDDQCAPGSSCPSGVDGREGLGLYLTRGGQRAGGWWLHVEGRGPAQSRGALPVGLQPGPVHRRAEAPEHLEGLADLDGCGVASKVPLHAVGEGGARQVAAAHEGHVEARAPQAPGLGVEDVALDPCDLDHPQLQVALQSHEALDGGGLGDDHVVPREQAEACSSGQGRLKGALQQGHPALHDEGGHDVDGVSAGDQRAELVQQMVCASSGQARGGRGDEAAPAVVAFAGDDEAHAPRWVVDVACETGNDVHMQVHDGLAGRLADVDADVEVGGSEAALKLLADLVHELHQGDLLRAGGLMPGPDLASRDDQGVSLADREAIADGEGQLVLGDPGRSRNRQEGTQVCSREGPSRRRLVPRGGGGRFYISGTFRPSDLKPALCRRVSQHGCERSGNRHLCRE